MAGVQEVKRRVEKQHAEERGFGRRRASMNEDLPMTPTNIENHQPKITKIKYQPPGTSRNKRPPGL